MTCPACTHCLRPSCATPALSAMMGALSWTCFFFRVRSDEEKGEDLSRAWHEEGDVKEYLHNLHAVEEEASSWPT